MIYIDNIEKALTKYDPKNTIIYKKNAASYKAEIIQTISLMNFLSFHGTVLLTDASRLQAQLNDVYISDTISLQIEQHDLLVLNKTDLLTVE